uniref:Uncharacterized protein n=1 Tax=Rhodnius prolixus TaxID=13249 RepID=T1I7R2_RHOPR
MKCILSLVTLFLVAAMAYPYSAELNYQQQLGDALREPAGEITEVHLVRMKRVPESGNSSVDAIARLLIVYSWVQKFLTEITHYCKIVTT